MFTLWEKVYLASLIFLQRSVVPLVTPSKFTHNDDYLIMEDESGRVKLIRDANLPSFYVTG
jgi:DNA polymerase delta subunit 2